MCPKEYVHKIERLQVEAKNIINSKKSFNELQLLEFNQIINLELIKMAYKSTWKQLPKCVYLLLNPRKIDHKYPTKDKTAPKIDCHESQLYNKSCLCKRSEKWQQLPQRFKSMGYCML